VKRGANDLHMFQLMSPSLHYLLLYYIQELFTFLIPAYPQKIN